ncbi:MULTISPECIES: acyl-CoA thioesterase [Thermomonosporaceae]|uniref:acyl-CoA thioesterase n=1 Tax=Thermomonosporaceae TaxID=2012 RepID=UPI00255B13FB|nr:MULTISPECIES: acyl-CoA thioesterase [Thermomonosporaceae]MDL4776725.1 acyl-CoA thioesterase [Actinomadura xylanilytica]
MRPYYEFGHRVTFAETNVVGNVYFTGYLSWQGACRELFLADKAPQVIDRLHRDLALVTVSCSCEYFSELFALDEVSVRMTLVRQEGNQMTMAFDYYRVGRGPALLVARGEQTVACMVRTGDGLVPEKIPDELGAALRPYIARTENGEITLRTAGEPPAGPAEQ